MEQTTTRLRSSRRSFSIIGFAFAALILVALIAQGALLLLPELLGRCDLEQQSWWVWVCASVPMYLFAYPVCILILRVLPAGAPEQKALTAKQFFTLIPICFCLMYAGSLTGTLLSSLLSGGQAVNALDEFAMDQSPLKILVMVILAPLFEELICRKLVIDRTVRYGEKLSVLMSGLIFGLLHQNLFQFFYAFALGSVFAYVYIRTGRIRYTIILHAIINFLGAVVAPAMLSLAPSDTTVGQVAETLDFQAMLTEVLSMLLVSAYGMCILGLSIAGLVLLLQKRKKLIWKETEQQLPRKQALKASLLNVGMILYGVICLVMIVLALFYS